LAKNLSRDRKFININIFSFGNNKYFSTFIDLKERINFLKVFLIYIRDEDYFNILPEKLRRSGNSDHIEIMAFPPLGIQTLTPVIRSHGHEVIMFDTCHPQMKEEHIEQAVKDEKPDVIGLSFLSTTSYLIKCCSDTERCAIHRLRRQGGR
jgi:hypothetical protein